MPQRVAQYRVRAETFEPHQSQWCRIGIHAVAAASIYSLRDDKRRDEQVELPDLARSPDYATD